MKECIGCEGNPTQKNNPCVVCGQAFAAPTEWIDMAEAKRRYPNIDEARQQAAVVPSDLTEALRQYRHNDREGIVFGYDKQMTDRYVAGLLAAAPQAEQVAEEPVVEPVEVGCVTVTARNGSRDFDFEEYSAAYALPEGLHQLYTAPPTPDVRGLVEALEDIAGKHHHSASAGSYFAEVARKALAAHKQEQQP